MPGIKSNNIAQFRQRVSRFSQRYIEDWHRWLDTLEGGRPYQLGVILRKWQACRPNSMRRTRAERKHPAPYLDDLILQSMPWVKALNKFDIRLSTSFDPGLQEIIGSLWEIFEQLSYGGRIRNGLAGEVGISKAVMLLTDGRVGPAFDSRVKGHLNIKTIRNANEWLDALVIVSEDIQTFEKINKTTLQQAVPDYAHLHSGRIYDMALGPGE